MLGAYTTNPKYIDVTKWCTVISPTLVDQPYVVGYSPMLQKWCSPMSQGSKTLEFVLGYCPIAVLAQNKNFTHIKTYNDCVVWIDLDTNKIYIGGEDVTKDYLRIQATFKGLGVKWSQIKCKNFINCPAESKYVWINAWYEAYRAAHPSFDPVPPAPSFFDKIKKSQTQANVYAWVLKNGVCTKQPVPKEEETLLKLKTQTIAQILDDLEALTPSGSF